MLNLKDAESVRSFGSSLLGESAKERAKEGDFISIEEMEDELYMSSECIKEFFFLLDLIQDSNEETPTEKGAAFSKTEGFKILWWRELCQLLEFLSNL